MKSEQLTVKRDRGSVFLFPIFRHNKKVCYSSNYKRASRHYHRISDNTPRSPIPGPRSLIPVPLLILSLLICISCSNNLQKPVTLRENITEGNVIVSLGGRARTLLPSQFDASRLYFVLRFKSTSENTELIEYLDCEDSMTMRLYMGFWDIDVWGYASEALAHDTEHDNTAQALVSGMQKNVEVKGMGTITEVSIELIPNVNKLTQDGEGMFRYRMSFPQGAEGGLSVYALAGGMLSGEPVETVLFTAQGGAASGELLLPSGFYGVVFSIEYNGNVKVWREIAHIYDYAITPAVYAFNAADFAFDPPGAMGEISFSSVDNNYAYEYLRESGTGGGAASVNILVPPGTDLSALCPLFSYTGARISPAPGTPLDFTVPQNFKIYCEDGIAEYEIAVTDTIGSAGLLADYLSHCPANDASSPVPVKVNVDLASDAQAVFSALDSAGRFADLDLSGSYGLGTFPAVSGGGKERVVSLVLPDSVSAIAADAFAGYAQLESISVSSGHAAFSSLDGVLYGDAMSALIAFPPAKAAASFAVPEGVVSIGSYAFSGCAGLAEINVPASVNGIWDNAFSSCENLVKVTVLGGIVPGRFPPNAFPGNLQPVYFAEGGGIGTYDRPSAASSEWVNHGIIFRVTNTGEWNAALGYIKGSGDNRVYTIEVDGNVAVPGAEADSFGLLSGLKITLNGNGTLALSSNGNVLRIANNQTLIIDSANLTLQGRPGNNSPVVYIDGENAKLELKNGSISGNDNNSPRSGGGVYIEYGSFIMTGGSISGNTASHSSTGDGGGVYINGGSFAMQGEAAVHDNIANNSGGGIAANGGNIAIEGNAAVHNNEAIKSVGGGVFVQGGGNILMQGNAIIHNNKTTSSNGGGVQIIDGGTFTMQGGEISGNEATGDGGGVRFLNSTFTMEAGCISENIANFDGGVGIGSGGTFTMQGGTISYNTANSGGGGVRVEDTTGSFIMEEGTISYNKNKAAGSYGGGVSVNGTFNMSGGVICWNTSVSHCGGVNCNGTFTMSGGEIKNNEAGGNEGGVGVWSGYTFIMEGGSICDNTATNGGGVGGGGSFTMEDGSISGNKASSNGGGVYVVGSFNMSGGEIKNNEAVSGGGVHVQPNQTFIMEGGSISENIATNGGGVRVEGSFTMKNNASVHDNTASGAGGGINIRGGTFTMGENATIYNNKAQGGGGGIDINNNGTFIMKGNVSIYGNTCYCTFDPGTSGVRCWEGSFRISGGIIYGNKETSIDSKGNPLANTLSGDGTALYVRSGFGTAQYGTFDSNGVFTAKGNLGTADDTVEVRDGIPVSYTSVQGVSLVLVPGGSFEMGKELGTAESGDLTPTSIVTLSGFYMARYQETQGPWQAVMGYNPSEFSSNPAPGETQARRPVERVSWYDAVEFCNKLSTLDGLEPVYAISGRTPASGYPITNANVTPDWTKNGYRLPTEAQWEYAAKGGASQGAYTYSGSNDPGAVAWYTSNSSSITHEVGKKQANGLGLHDMSGNVFELCWDWHGSYTDTPKTDPVGASSGSLRVARGGSWGSIAQSLRLAGGRYGSGPSDRNNALGFRLVRP